MMEMVKIVMQTEDLEEDFEYPIRQVCLPLMFRMNQKDVKFQDQDSDSDDSESVEASDEEEECFMQFTGYMDTD